MNSEANFFVAILACACRLIITLKIIVFMDGVSCQSYVQYDTMNFCILLVNWYSNLGDFLYFI